MRSFWSCLGLRAVRRLLARFRKNPASSKTASLTDLDCDTPSKSVLVRIPVDVLLTICDHLNQECQIALSLTCKALRATLTSNLDLRLHDRSTRIRLLHRLEIDHPQYLTCRSCAMMFKWRLRKHANYTCPHTRNHFETVQRKSITLIRSRLPRRRVLVNFETVDLISRAQRYGPEYGVSPSVLNSKGKGPKRIPRINEARWVDGRLLVAIHVAMLLGSRDEFLEVLARIDQGICPHPIRLIINPKANDNEMEQCLMSRCPYCQTDETLHLLYLENGKIQLTVNAWLDCGNREEFTRDDEATQPLIRLGRPRDVLRYLQKRNLQAQFESGEG